MRQYQLSLAALALRVNPFDSLAHRRIGRLLEDANPADAFAHYSVALALEPDQPFVRERRALMAFRQKRWPQVVADVNQILGQQPDRDRALLYRAKAYQRLGRHAEAAADLTAILRHYPRDGRFYNLRADSYQALGEKTRAEADRRKAREVAPEDARQLDDRAWRMLTGPPAGRDAAAALEIAQKAVDLVPNEAAYLNTLGVAQYRNGLFEEAIASLEKSRALWNGKSEAYDLFFLATCHQKLGDPDKARDCFDRAVRWWREQKDLPEHDIQELKAFQAEAEECLKNTQRPLTRRGK